MSTVKMPLMSVPRGSPIVPAQRARYASWPAILLGATILGAAAVAVASRSDTESVQPAQPAAKVEVHEVRLGTQIGGRVAVVHVAVGQHVEAGQPLVTFEAGELSARRDQAKSRLAAAESTLARVVNGLPPEELAESRVVADAARARLQRAEAGAPPEQIRLAQAELEVALADQQHADANFARAEQLITHGAMSRADYDTARADRDRAQHKAEAARAALDMLRNGTRFREIEEARAEVERAQAHYRQLSYGPRPEDRAIAEAAVALAQAQLAEAEVALRESVVTASERCVITQVLVRPGSIVKAKQPVVVAE